MNENNLTAQTILAYQSNGIDDIGKVEELGQFQYNQEQVVIHRNLLTAFHSMTADELDQYNYISADFNDDAIHSAKSVLRDHATNLADRYIWLGRDVMKELWNKTIQYKSGIHEFYCSTDGHTWTPADNLTECEQSNKSYVQ